MCVSLCRFAHTRINAGEAQRSVMRFPGTGYFCNHRRRDTRAITGETGRKIAGCDLPGVCAGNRTWIL